MSNYNDQFFDVSTERGYTEKTPITTFPSDGCDCPIDPPAPEPPVDPETNLLSKYAYLANFDKMSEKEKYALCLPMTVVVYSSFTCTNERTEIASDIINDKIVDTHMNTGRLIDNIQYDFSNNGVPTALLVFKPITESKGIPDNVISWARSHGFNV